VRDHLRALDATPQASKDFDSFMQIGVSDQSAQTAKSKENKPKVILDNYQLGDEIGRGSMGIIYAGKDLSSQKPVAIKIFDFGSQRSLHSKISRQSFQQELLAAGSLSHNNIVTLFDAEMVENKAYIIMEPLPGHDLRYYLENDNTLNLEQILDLSVQCALALDYAHRNHIVHMDIKPGNLMYSIDQKTLKITDFGVAHYMGTYRQTDKVLGSPSYMSPEQLSGKSVDGRSDLFSLGVVMFHLLCGRLPFISNDMRDMMGKIVNKSHPDVTLLRTDLPTAVRSIMDKALAKTPDDRYQRGHDMAVDMKMCLNRLLKQDKG